MVADNRAIEPYDVAPLAAAVRKVANLCDGGVSEDGVGFSRADAPLMSRIALIPDSRWTESIAYEAWVAMSKYEKQLEKLGIKFDSIAPPPRKNRSRFASEDISEWMGRNNTISSNGELFAIHAKYDEQVVELLKNIPRMEWNTATSTWLAPLSSAQQVGELVSNYGFALDEDAAKMIGELNYSENTMTKTITKTRSGKLVFEFPYNHEILAAIKKIPGRQWDMKKKVWTAPVHISAVELADLFEFEIDDKLRAEILESVAKEAELLQKSNAVDAEISVPTLSGTLLPYQRAGVAYASNVGRCLIADQMGLGKTVEAIATLEARDAFPAIIVCPASLKENWRREITKWLPHRTVNVVSGKDDIVNCDVNVVNYDILFKFVDAIKHLKPSGIVLDESHYVKNGAAKRAKAAKEIASVVPASGSVLLLSGTPVTNRPEELVSQLEIMGMLGRFGGKWAFLRRYAGAHHNGFGWDTSGASNLTELNTKLRQNCYIRRTKDEVLTELPPKTRNVIHVDPSGKGFSEYRKAENDLISFLQSHGYKTSDSGEHMARTQVLKRLAAHAKMDAVTEWIDSFLESCDRKLVVFAHNVEVVDALAERYGHLRVSGQDSLEDRQDAVDSFQNDPESRVIVLNLQAGGVGITLTAASDVLFVQMGWTPGEHDQAEDRCHRLGQKSNVQAWYLLGAGTIDEDIYDLVDAKRSIVDAVTEGDEVEQKNVVGDLMKRLLAKTA